MALVLDTGVIFAALDQTDADHLACDKLIAESEEQLVIPGPVLVELDYMVRKHAGVDAWLTFCEDVAAGGYAVFRVDAPLVEQAAQIQARFADQPIGFVDASVVATCEALGENKVATLDHRHFSILRTKDGEALELLPE